MNQCLVLLGWRRLFLLPKQFLCLQRGHRVRRDHGCVQCGDLWLVEDVELRGVEQVVEQVVAPGELPDEEPVVVQVEQQGAVPDGRQVGLYDLLATELVLWGDSQRFLCCHT